MRTIPLSACLVALAAAAFAPMMSSAASAHSTVVSVQDVNGVRHTIPDPDSKATVLFFISKDCPISNGAAPEMKRIVQVYGKKGFDFLYIYGSPYATKASTKAHAESYGFIAPCVVDSSQVLVRDTAATTTPETVVISPKGKMLYHGRIDNRYDAIGVQRTLITQHDLTDALDAIAAGKAPPHVYEAPVGCTIPTAGPV